MNKAFLQISSLYVFPNFKYLSKYFAQIYRAQYGTAMLVYIRSTPTWRAENSVNIWNLLWL